MEDELSGYDLFDNMAVPARGATKLIEIYNDLNKSGENQRMEIRRYSN